MYQKLWLEENSTGAAGCRQSNCRLHVNSWLFLTSIWSRLWPLHRKTAPGSLLPMCILYISYEIEISTPHFSFSNILSSWLYMEQFCYWELTNVTASPTHAYSWPVRIQEIFSEWWINEALLHWLINSTRQTMAPSHPQQKYMSKLHSRTVSNKDAVFLHIQKWVPFYWGIL